MPEFEITSAERLALARLGDHKDFGVLLDVLSRWLAYRSQVLVSEPKSEAWQWEALIRLQGAYDAWKRIQKFISPDV